jgi:molybdate transport system substrate-binding protein
MAVVAVVGVAGACGGPAKSSSATTLRVFAASSLSEAFGELAKAFEADHEGVQVELNLGGSSSLVQQINAGAPADVIATADEVTMQALVDDGRTLTKPKLIARNTLVVVVEPGNPKAIATAADLAKPGVVFAACAPEVPCGRLAAAVLQRAGVTAQPATREENVKGVVAKVALGEVDAGLVYASDAKAAAADTDTVAIDGADDPALQARYPIAVVRGARNRKSADDLIEFVSSSEGERVLAKHGFLRP